MAPAGGPKAGDAFASFLGLRWGDGDTLALEIRPELINNGGRLLGPVAFALADYGMSAALWARLADDEACATVNVAINFVDTATAGTIICSSRIDRRTRRLAATSCELRHADGRLLATALGSFAITLPRPASASPPA